jgi:hypothetical protein
VSDSVRIWAMAAKLAVEMVAVETEAEAMDCVTPETLIPEG